MAKLLVLGLSLLCTALVFGQEDPVVEVDISHSIAHVGTNITVDCRIRNPPAGSFVYWFKAIIPDESELDTTNYEIIATNDVLVPLYQKTGRYVAMAAEAGDTRMYMLHIYQVTDEESGYFGCILPTQQLYDHAKFEVYEEPDDMLLLVSPGNMSDKIEPAPAMGMVALFHEGMPANITCIVSQAAPAPQLKIMIDSVDYTDKFTRKENINTYCSGGLGSKTCPLHTDYSVVLTTDRFEPEFDHDHKELSCVASIPRSGFEPRTEKVLMDVKYAAKFPHCDTEVDAKLDAKNVELKCETRFNPGSKNMSWTFTVSGKEYNLTPENLQEDEFVAAFVQDDFDGKIFTMKLTIAQVKEQHYVQYNLHARNIFGHADSVVKLSKDLSGSGGSTGGASIIPVSLTAFFLSILLALSTRT